MLPSRLTFLWHQQHGLCFYCGLDAWLGIAEGAEVFARRIGVFDRPHGRREWRKLLEHFKATEEHLIRRAEGGDHRPGNIVMACATCNHGRGAVPSLVYFAKQRALSRSIVA